MIKRVASLLVGGMVVAALLVGLVGALGLPGTAAGSPNPADFTWQSAPTNHFLLADYTWEGTIDGPGKGGRSGDHGNPHGKHA